MAYCRFSEGDVYLYGSDEGYVCCWCLLLLQPVTDMGFHRSLTLATTAEAIAHLEAHRTAGHNVPEEALEMLREELAEEPSHD